MKRTFIAIKTAPGEKIKDCISHSMTCLKGERIKWVNPTQLHFTLAFLGDTRLDQVDRTVEMLDRIIPAFESPVVQYRGLGLFRNLKEPRVLWIGLDINAGLRTLKEELDRELKVLGFRLDTREFRPHLTLARIKWIQNRGALEDLLGKYRDYHFQESRIHDMYYYESVLGQEGPRYKVLRNVGFRYASP